MHVASNSAGPKVTTGATSEVISVPRTAQCRNAPVGPKPESGSASVILRHIRPNMIKCARRAAASQIRSEPVDQANAQPIPCIAQRVTRPLNQTVKPAASHHNCLGDIGRSLTVEP